MRNSPRSSNRGLKDPRLPSGLSSKLSASKSIRYSSLSSGLLDRLVGVARQAGIHLTELRQLGNIGFNPTGAATAAEMNRATAAAMK